MTEQTGTKTLENNKNDLRTTEEKHKNSPRQT